MIFNFLTSLAIMLAVAAVPLLLYSARSTGSLVWKGDGTSTFTFKCFLLTSRSRLFYGLIAMAIVSAVLTLVPGAGDALAVVGFAAGGTEVALGFTIGGLLVAAVSGDYVPSTKDK